MASKFFQSSGSSCSSSSSRSGWIYDVFLSFRGEDTRKTFTGHLYASLVQAGIRTFRDDDELPKGEEISPQLLKAIQGSKISLVIFSKGYASSRWCLDELVEILECRHRNEGQMVIPIFYDVDPSDVRRQTGRFAEAFQRHEQHFNEKVNRWRDALLNAGNLSGWSLKDLEYGHESKFIQAIVKDVLRRLDRNYLNVAKHVVGIEARVDDIIGMLIVDTNDVRIVGLHGMGGIGKTTIAKVVYNRLCDGFKGSFLSNVKEISEKPSGLVELQKQLLCDILKQDTWKIYDVDRGINLIKERLCCERILLVLDDVNKWNQLEALVGGRSWFGPGSRIIITTRNVRLLTELGVDEAYQVKGLDGDVSLQLFSWHAFRNSHPIDGFRDLSYDVVRYCGGVPLALKVLGSSLFKRNKHEWKSTIEKLLKIPNNQIHEKLRISFDSLDDHTQKGAFLDIACFFVGWNKEYVAKVLDGRGFFADGSIGILAERSLVTINRWNLLEMHDLVRDMGREIVREISPVDPGQRSRIWFREDVLNVLDKQMGTAAVEGLTLDVQGPEAMVVSSKSFAEMRHLKLLQISGVRLTGSHKHISKELIWLCWHKCSMNFILSNFQIDKLVVLDMQNSDIKELWKGTKFLDKLKVLNLSNSKSLSKTPNLLSSSLEKLILEGCSSLIEVHPSIGNSRRLILLNLKGCCRLKNLPESMADLKSLLTLNITNCSKLKKLPERLGDMESLSELLADGTTIKELPSSIGHLKNLKKFSLNGMESNERQNLPYTFWLSVISSWLWPRNSNPKALLPASFFGLHSLVELQLGNCGLCEGVISNADFASLYSLELLNLSGNNFFNLPSSIACLPKLKYLWVGACKNVVSISDLPSCLLVLSASDCASLERVSIQSKTRAIILLDGCRTLREIEGMEGVDGAWSICLQGCNNLSNNAKIKIIQAMCKQKDYAITFLGNEIPEWFSYHREGFSVSLKVPNSVSDGILQAVLVWVVVSGSCTCVHQPIIYYIEVQNKSNGSPLFERRASFRVFNRAGNKYSWISKVTLSGYLDYCSMKAGDELELSVRINPGVHGRFAVEKCGVHPMMVKNAEKFDDYVEEESQGSVGATTIVTCPSPLRSTGWLKTEFDRSPICEVRVDPFA